MTNYIWIVLSVVLVSMRSDDDRRDLLSHRWIQFACKPDTVLLPQMIDRSKAKELTLDNNGTYTEWKDILKRGNWYLSKDETEMEFIISSVNGVSIPHVAKSRHYNITILRLNSDTLIYREVYAYKSNQYNDWYYVRDDNYNEIEILK